LKIKGQCLKRIQAEYERRMQEGSNPGSVIQEKTGMEKTGKVQKKQG
jgi:hypothetical protein